MKACTVCKAVLPRASFYFQGGTRVSGACRPCYKERAKGYATRPRAESLAKSAQKLRAIVNAAKDGPCLDCGGRFHPVAMDFDHVRGTKRTEIGRLVWDSVSEKTLREELAKCELVCSNCHRVRTHLRRPTGFSIGGSAIRKPDVAESNQPA